MRLIFVFLLGVTLLSGCGKSKLEQEISILRSENIELKEKIYAAKSKLTDAQNSVQSAQSEVEDLQGKIRMGNLYGFFNALDDIGYELDSADSDIDDAIRELI